MWKRGTSSVGRNQVEQHVGEPEPDGPSVARRPPAGRWSSARPAPRTGPNPGPLLRRIAHSADHREESETKHPNQVGVGNSGGPPRGSPATQVLRRECAQHDAMAHRL